MSGKMDLELKLITFSIFDSVAMKVGFFLTSVVVIFYLSLPWLFHLRQSWWEGDAAARYRQSQGHLRHQHLQPRLDLCLGPHLDPQVLLDATKPQDGVNGSAGGHAEEGQANGSEVPTAPLSVPATNFF